MRPLILVLALFPAFALAQTGDSTRGNTPPGMSQDGSRPMDGAVKGGSIVPGETAGVPNDDSQTSSTERRKRCDELSGKLRDDCIAKERSAAGGSSVPPRPRNKERPIERSNDALEKSQTPYGAD
ncbi:MAG: hypothetical protein JO292_00435 [Betaproteobacteria bacterium]|nr:hypothetical protein [Betaproteobacteria bacterium]MBV9359829.1 hypothetical protein [Betaproteobacteria bacterium]